MTDKSVVEKIIQAMPDTSGLSLVEIGPGLGDLTKSLIRRAAVEAYEVDEDLYEHLQNAFKNEITSGRLSLKLGDVLDFWSKGSLKSDAYFLTANIPYYITAPIIYRALEDKNCAGMILMVQKEVAEKLSAKVGKSEYGILSVLAQNISDTQTLFEVPPSAFNPPPKVTSAVVKLIKKKDFSEPFGEFKEYLRAAFASPRKTLFKNISARFDKSRLGDIFDELNFAQNLRPHELQADKHLCLFRKLAAL